MSKSIELEKEKHKTKTKHRYEQVPQNQLRTSSSRPKQLKKIHALGFSGYEDLEPCDDFHVFSKFVTRLTSRDIIMSDKNVFHHFRNSRVLVTSLIDVLIHQEGSDDEKCIHIRLRL
ncbi:hypothetical protein YC2023_019228 [Brassica napus]